MGKQAGQCLLYYFWIQTLDFLLLAVATDTSNQLHDDERVKVDVDSA